MLFETLVIMILKVNHSKNQEFFFFLYIYNPMAIIIIIILQLNTSRNMGFRYTVPIAKIMQ